MSESMTAQEMVIEILNKYNSFAIAPGIKESLADRFYGAITESYASGFSAGAREMQERAAKLVDELRGQISAYQIRELPLPATKGEKV